MTGPPITLLLGGIAAILVASLVFRWFVITYRTPTGPERVVALFLGLLVVESFLYADPNAVPSGIFHPTAGPLSFRLFDILIPFAVAARLVARPSRHGTPLQVLLWGAFLAWIGVSGLQGIEAGNSTGLVAYHAKAVLYLGVLVITADVAPRRWLESRPLRRVVLMSSALAAVLLVMSQGHVAVDIPIPMLDVTGLGVLGADAASIFTVLGVATVMVAICSERRRLSLVLVALPLLAAPLAAGQRAAIVALAIAAALTVVLVALTPGRVRITPTEVALGLTAALGLFMAVVTVAALSGDSTVNVPLASQIQETFGSRGKQLSEQDRVNQWDQARALIADHPWFGSGLGKQYYFYSPGFYEFMKTDLTHNIGFDLLLRSGIIGLLLFVAAAAVSVRDAILAWFGDGDDRIAALGLACAAALLGLLGKGMFESLFEKYRLAIMVGGLLGMSASLAVARLEPRPEWLPEALRRRVDSGAGALAR